MKKSRSHAINDRPHAPTRFQHLHRKDTRALQRHLADLKATAALRQYVPEEERARATLAETTSGALRELSPVRDIIQRIQAAGWSVSPELEAYVNSMRARAGKIGATAINTAAVDLQDGYARVTQEVSQSLVRGDVASVQQALALWGFDLFANDFIRASVQQQWLDGKKGNKASARFVQALVSSLSVGRGPLSDKTERQRREDRRKRKRKFDSRVREAEEHLTQTIARDYDEAFKKLSKAGKTRRAAAKRATKKREVR